MWVSFHFDSAVIGQVIPELDWLHVFLPESLELGRHWLVTVPESLSVLLGRFWLRDLNPEENNVQTYDISRCQGTDNITSLTHIRLKNVSVKRDCSYGSDMNK